MFVAWWPATDIVGAECEERCAAARSGEGTAVPGRTERDVLVDLGRDVLRAEHSPDCADRVRLVCVVSEGRREDAVALVGEQRCKRGPVVESITGSAVDEHHGVRVFRGRLARSVVDPAADPPGLVHSSCTKRK